MHLNPKVKLALLLLAIVALSLLMAKGGGTYGFFDGDG
jgi:hypothetical protein